MADPVLHESPYSIPHRPLRDEPLTVDDWRQVNDAYRAFVVQIRMIVARARKREAAKEQQDRAEGR